MAEPEDELQTLVVVTPNNPVEGGHVGGGNEKFNGSIKIHKRIKRAGDSDIDGNFGSGSFKVRLTSPNGYDKTQTINKNENTGDNTTFKNLAPGKYYISEENLGSEYSGYYIADPGNHGDDVGNEVEIKGNGNENRWLINILKEPEQPWKGTIKILKTMESQANLSNHIVGQKELILISI